MKIFVYSCEPAVGVAHDSEGDIALPTPRIPYADRLFSFTHCVHSLLIQ